MTFRERFGERAADWLFQQGTSTVLLVGIWATMAWGGWYAMTTAIPAHLTQIQDGYQRQSGQFEAALEAQRLHDIDELNRHDANVDRLIQAIERARSNSPAKSASLK